MDLLLQTGKYGAINTTYTTTMGYYVIKLLSESYTLQEDTTCNRKIGIAGELVLKSQYTECMKYYTKWYQEKSQQQKSIIVPTRKNVHPCLYVIAVTEAKQITKSVCNRNQASRDLQRRHIKITDSDHDFILDEIKRRYTIEHERGMSVDDKEYQFT